MADYEFDRATLQVGPDDSGRWFFSVHNEATVEWGTVMIRPEKTSADRAVAISSGREFCRKFGITIVREDLALERFLKKEAPNGNDDDG